MTNPPEQEGVGKGVGGGILDMHCGIMESVSQIYRFIREGLFFFVCSNHGIISCQRKFAARFVATQQSVPFPTATLFTPPAATPSTPAQTHASDQ